jgi:hypothetical protein
MSDNPKIMPTLPSWLREKRRRIDANVLKAIMGTLSGAGHSKP